MVSVCLMYLSTLVAVPAQAGPSLHFTVTLIGAPHQLVRITGINRWGTVVGNFTDHGSNDRSFLFRNGQIANLRSPEAGAPGNDVFGISDGGVVADSPPIPPATSEGGNASEAYALTLAGSLVRGRARLEVPGSNYEVWADAWANSVNHDGWIAGGIDGREPTDPTYGASVLWHQSSGQWHTILLARSKYFPQATAADSFGDAVGYTSAGDATTPTGGIFWASNRAKVFLSGAHAKPDAVSTVRTSSGQKHVTIVGSFELNNGNSTPCAWHVTIPLKTSRGLRRKALAAVSAKPSSVGEAEAINSSGWTTGWLVQSNRQLATLWAGIKVYDLNLLIPSHPTWKLIDATAINERGQIGATAQLADGREQAVRLTPVES